MDYKGDECMYEWIIIPEVFISDCFSQTFRNQVYYILEDVLEPYSTFNENLRDIFVEKYCREKG